MCTYSRGVESIFIFSQGVVLKTVLSCFDLGLLSFRLKVLLDPEITIFSSFFSIETKGYLTLLTYRFKAYLFAYFFLMIDLTWS